MTSVEAGGACVRRRGVVEDHVIASVLPRHKLCPPRTTNRTRKKKKGGERKEEKKKKEGRSGMCSRVCCREVLFAADLWGQAVALISINRMIRKVPSYLRTLSPRSLSLEMVILLRT